MTKLNYISRFWRHLLDSGGSMTRWDLGKKVFSGNWAKHEMDELLRYPLLSGLIELTRERTNDRRGPIPTRIVLTAAGFALAKMWQAKMPSTDLPLERIREQFNKLVAAGAPWAADLMKYAALGRSWEEQERQRKEARRLKDEERRKRQAEANPPVKNPSKGRHRSEKEEADRAAWRDAHFRKPAPPAASVAQSEPPWRPSQLEAPRVAPEPPLATPGPYRGAQSWMNDIGFVSSPVPRSAPPPDENPKLLEKIARAGYQTRNGRVLYGGDRWITPEEWVRLMPGIVD